MPTPNRLAVIITALPLERSAVLAHLRGISEEPPVNGSIYRRGIFDEQSDPWDVIVAEIGAGNVGAAAEAVRVISHYSPQVALFVGVGGAIKDLKHGDVVASSKVYGYESGKDDKKDFKPRPALQLTSYGLEQRARYEAGEPDWRQRIKAAGPGVEPDAKVAPIAAGEKVVASNRSQTFKFIRQHYSDAVAVEMEGHGFMLGVHMNHPTQGIVIRGISDLVNDKDEANDDTWQPIAASHAAAFAFQMLAKLSPDDSGVPQTAATTNQVTVGDVSGDNNILTIHQHQGPTLDDLVRLIQPASPDANAEIDAACARMNAGEPDIAIHLLTEMQKKRWDKLTSREKYRVLANIGHAMERKGEFKKAAQYYMEAKQHQPQDEKARALEAIAFFHLGEEEKAYQLSCGILEEHPTCTLAIVMRVRCAPPNVPIQSLEQEIPAAVREEMDILHALSWRALKSGDVIAAERFCRTALKHQPDSTELQEQLAAIVVQAASQAKLANQPINTSKLEDSIKAISAGLAKNWGPKDASRLRYTRAEAYDLLGRTEEAETDFRAAIEIDIGQPGIVHKFALFLARHERDDAAIEALRKADKEHVDVNNRLLLASLLGDRKKTSDWDSAARLLRETIPMATTGEPEVRAAVVSTLVQLLGCLKRYDDALKLIDELEAGFLAVPATKAIRSLVLLRAGRKEEARTCAMEGLLALGTDSDKTDRIRVADALGFVGEKEAALGLWKSVLKPDRVHPFTSTALEIARECGDDRFILSFCKELRAAGIHYPHALELEVITQEKYRLFDEAIGVMQTYLGSQPDEDLAQVFRVRLSLLGIRLGRSELVETDLSRLPPVEKTPVKIGVAVAHILINGPGAEQGLDYIYELVRRHYANATARQAYVGIIGIGDDRVDLIPAPSSVAPGCAVKYKADDSGEEKWVIIEDGVEPRPERDEIEPSHTWAKEMAGKFVGDKFHLRRDAIQSRTATIQAICSKYAYRKLEILETWEDRFPDKFFVRKYTAPTQEDGSPDISLMLKSVDLREQEKERMHAFYRENPISPAVFASLADAGLVESLSHLASEGTLPIRCCTGTSEELEQAEAAIASAGVLVLDPSSLATLFFSGQYKHLHLLTGKCVICGSALEEYIELKRKFASPSQGFMGKFKGKYLFQQDDPGERKRQEERLENFLAVIRSLGTLRSGENLAGVDPRQREELIGLFGQPTAEAIAEASAIGSTLWTDDVAVAVVARERLGVAKRVWTQVVFKSIAPADAYADLTLFLLQWRYFFTRVEPEIIVRAGDNADWEVNLPSLACVLGWLSAPELQHRGAVFVAGRMLPLIWLNAPHTHQREAITRALALELFKRTGGRKMIADIIIPAIDQLFGMDLLGGQACKSFLQALLAKGKDIGLIIPESATTGGSTDAPASPKGAA